MNSLPITSSPRVSFSHMPSTSSPSGFFLRKQLLACGDSFLEEFLFKKASEASPGGVVRFLSSKLKAGWMTVDMEWCSGGDLLAVVEMRASRNQPFSADCLYDLTEQMLTTLNQLHSQRIAHRRICLRHWVLQGTVVKLIDFSCAKLIKRNETVDAHTLRNSRENISPEVLESAKTAPKVSNDPFKEDIWALGKVLYELATCKYYGHLNSKPTEVLSEEVQQHLTTLGYGQFTPVILAMLAWGRSNRVTASQALTRLRHSFSEDSEYHWELLVQ